MASASSTARWWFSRDTFNALATVSSLYRFRLGRSTRARATVSMTVGWNSYPRTEALWLMKPTSKDALWATSTAPRQNSRNRPRTGPMVSAPMTMASFMPVSRSISKGMGTSGSTNSSMRSVITPFSTLTAPISMILFFTGEKPVVSISKNRREAGSPRRARG